MIILLDLPIRTEDRSRAFNFLKRELNKPDMTDSYLLVLIQQLNNNPLVFSWLVDELSPANLLHD